MLSIENLHVSIVKIKRYSLDSWAGWIRTKVAGTSILFSWDIPKLGNLVVNDKWLLFSWTWIQKRASERGCHDEEPGGRESKQVTIRTLDLQASTLLRRMVVSWLRASRKLWGSSQARQLSSTWTANRIDWYSRRSYYWANTT